MYNYLPRSRAHCFSFLQVRHIRKTRTSSSDQNFILGYLLTLAMRYGGSKSAQLSNPLKWPTVLLSCKQGSFWQAPTGSSHQKFILGYLRIAE